MNMQTPTRRNALLGLSAAGAGATLATPAIAQAGRRLTMVTTWPRGLPGLWSAAERVAARITALSGGALAVEAFAAGEKMGAFDSFPAVQAGDADMYHAAEYYWQGTDRAYNFFTTVPFGFTAEEHTAWIRRAGGQALWDELAAERGLKGFACGNTGVQMGGWYDRKITSLEDMKGLRIRIPGVAAAIFKTLGSEPVSLPGGAIPEALFSGQINAVEWVGPYNDLNFGVQKVLRHYMYPGFHEPGTAASLGINLALWNSLSDTERAIIEAAAAAENRIMLAEYTANSGRALAQMVREYGTEVSRFPDDLYAEFAALSASELAAIGAGSRFAQRVLTSFEAFRKTLVPYAGAMSAGYSGLRSTHLRG